MSIFALACCFYASGVGGMRLSFSSSKYPVGVGRAHTLGRAFSGFRKSFSIMRAPCKIALGTGTVDDSAVFEFSSSEDKWLDSLVSEHFHYVSLEDIFGAAMADAFHNSEAFRDDLQRFAASGAMKGLFAVEGFSSPSYALSHERDVRDAQIFGRLHMCNAENMKALTRILANHVGPNAPSASEFVAAFANLCGDHRRGMFTSLGPKAPANAVYWHQDWDPPDENSFTVMFGFPPTNNYEGVGVFTELIRLSHRFNMAGFTMSKFPYDEDRLYTAQESNEIDRKSQAALGITDAYRVQPIFRRGQEVLIYKDSDHLHRSPTPDTIGREDCWRFA